MTDLALLQRWTETRDPEAFKEIASRHGAMVYATCKRILGDAAEAEDVAQECFETLAQTRKGPKEHLGTWLHAVATNRSLNRIRAEKRRRDREAAFAARRAAHTQIVWDDVYEYVDEAIAELPQKLRAPIIAHFLEEQSHAAIAQAAGVSPRTVAYRIRKGTEFIRKSLKRRGVPVAASTFVAMMGANLAEAAPPSLAATLGKLSLAGVDSLQSATVAGGTAVFKTVTALGGVLVMKKAVLVGAVLIAIGLAGTWVVVGQKGVDSPLAIEVSAPAAQSEPPPSETTGPTVPEPAAVSEFGSVSQVTSGAVSPSVEAAPEGRPSPEPGTVSGRVVDRQGNGIEGAKVLACVNNVTLFTNTSGKDGAFGLGKVAPVQDLYVQAETADFLSEPHGPFIVTADGSLADLVIPLTRPRTSSIAGIIVDGAGRPVSGVKLVAWPGKSRYMDLCSVNSDEDGAFDLTGLVQGDYALIPETAPGSGRWSTADVAAQVPLGLGERVTGIRIVYERAVGAVIAGRVVDRDGKPVSNAHVLNLSVGSFSVPESTRQDGTFRLAVQEDSINQLQVVHFEYNSVLVENVAAGREGLEVVLDKQPNLEGCVLGADTGKPLTSFEITVKSRQEVNLETVVGYLPDGEPLSSRTWNSEQPWKQVSDAEGRFQIAIDASADSTTLTVRAAGYATASVDVEKPAPGQDIPELVLRLEPSRTVRGSVNDGQGKPIRGAFIFVGELPKRLEESNTLARLAVAQSDAQGEFELNSLRPEDLVAWAYHPSYVPGAAEIDHARPVRIVLYDEGVIEGQITENGHAATSAAVDVVPEYDWPFETFSSQVGSDGTFSVGQLAAGEVRVLAGLQLQNDEHREQTRRAVVKPAEVTVVNFDFLSDTGALEGVLTANGQPLAGSWLEMVIVTAYGEETVTAKGGEDGAYLVGNLPAGAAMVQVGGIRSDGTRVVQSITVEVVSGQVIRRDIDFTGARFVEGTVRGVKVGSEAGVLVVPGEADVRVFNSDLFQQWQQVVAGVADLDAKGSFRIEGLESGIYTVIAFGADRSLGQAERFDTASFASRVVDLNERSATGIELTLR